MKKSILSMVMALVMAFSCIGLAATEEGTISFDAKISADIPALMVQSGEAPAELPEDAQQALNAVNAILNTVTLKGVFEKDAGEVALYAGDDLMLSIGAKKTEEGATIASTLLGNQVLFLSNEMVQQMQQQIQQQAATSATASAGSLNELQNIDKEQLGKDVAEIAEKLSKAFSEKVGEPENGEFTVDGMTFTVKTPVNITYAEASELILNSAKELLGKDSMKAVLKAFSQKGDPIEEIDKAIEKIKNQPAEEQPELSAAIYSNDKDDNYVVIEMTKKTAATETEEAKEEKVYFAEGLADGTVKILLTADAEKEDIEFAFNAAEGNTSLLGKIADTKGMNMDIDLNADQAGNLVMNLAIKDKDVNVKASAKVEAAEGDRKNFTVDVFANDSEKALLTITGSAGKSEDKPVSVFEGENITVLPLEKLTSGEDATVTGQLSLTATANLLKSVTVLAKNLPEDAAAWLNAQVKQLMVPKKPAVTVLPHAAE